MSNLGKILNRLGLITLIVPVMAGCGSNESEQANADGDVAGQSLPLNISVYLDLSDRLMRDLTPTQSVRDIEIVDHLADLFSEDCIKNGKIINSKNHFQVFFYPAPNNSEIATLAKGLNVDLNKLPIQEKKVELKNMKERFNKNLTQIYEDAVSDGKFPGCDVWGFFSNKNVDNLCIRKGYRNILVILTDGYLYHEANKVKEGNSYSYVLPKTLADAKSSLIVKRDGLDNLEILMLEINPYQPTQRERLVAVLENWFESMGVKHFVVSETALPVNTENVIDAFFQE